MVTLHASVASSPPATRVDTSHRLARTAGSVLPFQMSGLKALPLLVTRSTIFHGDSLSLASPSRERSVRGMLIWAP